MRVRKKCDMYATETAAPLVELPRKKQTVYRRVWNQMAGVTVSYFYDYFKSAVQI